MKEDQTLKEYVQKAREVYPQSLPVQYFQKVFDDDITYERKFASGNSLQKLSKEARNAACHGTGVEIDVNNAHPSLLLSILEENEPEHNKTIFKLFCKCYP